ncbi:hypothetical protein AGMMS49992_05310 [Clostridia bacterium]|nr:hypothetical protein AGMMS49992_05310 [Clostridia bacterium]
MKRKALWTSLICIVLVMMCAAAIAQDEPTALTLPVLDLTSGESYAIADIFPDPDAAIAAMESIAERDMTENGNAYMENRTVTPLPLDNWEVDEYGVIIRYPIDRLSTFSGRPGAYQFNWYELEGLYDAEFVEGIHERAQSARIEAESEPNPLALPGIPVSLGDELERLALIYGGGKESDFTETSQAYRLEDARFRGVTILTSRDDPTGTGEIIEIRAARLDYDGLCVGVSDEQAVLDLLGEPDAREPIGEDASYYQLLPEGEILWYDREDVRLGMLVDGENTLVCIILKAI